MSQSLHIAMVTRIFSTGGGLELYAHKLIEELLVLGHKVSVVCETAKSNLRHPNLQIVTFSAPDKKLSKAERLAHYYQATSAAVSRLPAVDLTHSQHLPVNCADVVNFHNQSTRQLSRVGLGWERWLNAAKTAFIPAYRRRDEYDRLLCRNASCLVFSSKIGRDDFLSTYAREIGNTPTKVAYPGAALANGTMLVPAEPGRSFLFVGRGYRKKGLDILLAACRILAGQGVDFELLIAGLTEKPLDRLRLQALGINRHVKYLGWQDNMAYVYNQARALIMPSRLEPFGMAALQAMQAGLVPIVSRVSGVSEIIKPGYNGFILENHLDARELAELMKNALTADDQIKAMSSNARETAVLYSWKATAQAVLQAYELALQKKYNNRPAPGVEHVP